MVSFPSTKKAILPSLSSFCSVGPVVRLFLNSCTETVSFSSVFCFFLHFCAWQSSAPADNKASTVTAVIMILGPFFNVSWSDFLYVSVTKVVKTFVFLSCEGVRNRRFGLGRKCSHKNFNSVRNCVKVRILAYRNFGRKCC